MVDLFCFDNGWIQTLESRDGLKRFDWLFGMMNVWKMKNGHFSIISMFQEKIIFENLKTPVYIVDDSCFLGLSSDVPTIRN